MSEDSGSMMNLLRRAGRIRRIRMVIVADESRAGKGRGHSSYSVPVEVEVERRNGKESTRQLEEGTVRVSAPRLYAHRLPVKRSGGVVLYVEIRRIDWIEAVNQYVRLYVHSDKYLLRESLTHLEGKLEPRRFQRIHRSTIVNLERVRELHMESSSFRWAVLDCGRRLRVSQGYWSKLQHKMQGFG